MSFVLIALLKEIGESITIPGATLPAYTRIILKCLEKSYKRIESDSTTEYSKILKEVHVFFQNHPLESWKDADQSVIKFIKKLLNTIIQLKKSEILKYLTFLDFTQSPQDIYILIDKLLHKNGLPSRKVELCISIRNSKYGKLPETEEKDLIEILTSIYKTIFNKETCLQGLADLVVLRHYNPNLLIDKYIQSSPDKLQSFIIKGLSRFTNLNIDSLRTSSDSAFKLSVQPNMNIALQFNENSLSKAEDLVGSMKQILSKTTYY